MIGSEEYPFSGTFDGAGYSITIDHIYYNHYSGLLGSIFCRLVRAIKVTADFVRNIPEITF